MKSAYNMPGLCWVLVIWWGFVYIISYHLCYCKLYKKLQVWCTLAKGKYRCSNRRMWQRNYSGLRSQKRPCWGSNRSGAGWRKHGLRQQKRLSGEGYNVHHVCRERPCLAPGTGRTLLWLEHRIRCVFADLSGGGDGSQAGKASEAILCLSREKMFILRAMNRNSNKSKMEHHSVPSKLSNGNKTLASSFVCVNLHTSTTHLLSTCRFNKPVFKY